MTIFLKKTYVLFFALIIAITAFSLPKSEGTSDFLAPKSNYRNVAFAQILSEYIIDLNELRSDSDAFFALKNKFKEAVKDICPGDFSLNTLDSAGNYYRCSFLEKKAHNSFVTHSYLINKKSGEAQYNQHEGNELYQSQLMHKVLRVLKSNKKDYSLDEYLFITDPHGAYYNILTLIAHKFNVEFTDIKKEAKRIEDEIIKKANYSNYKFNFNGDIPDRAPYTLKTYRFVKRILKEVPGSMYQTGNHDLWAMLNVMGYHLPSYEGYQGIPENTYSYVSIDDLPKGYKSFTPHEFVDDGVKHNLVRVNLKHFMDEKRKQDKSAADKKWWADKYRSFMKKTKEAQSTKWKHLKDEVTAMYATFYDNRDIKNFMNDDHIPEDERRFWGDILGFSFVSRVKIDTGVLAVERMPLSWWQERLTFLNDVLIPRYEKSADIRAVLELNEVMSQITRTLESDLKRKAVSGDWSDIIINEGINQGAFGSLEWMVADWVFHGADKDESALRKGSAWGPSAVFERINEVLEENNAQAPWEEGTFSYYEEYKIKDLNGNTITLPNCVNYLEDKEFVEFGNFLKENFTVVSKDIYQNTYMHAFFPVKEIDRKNARLEFRPEFEYKGETYSGRDIFKGMALMEDDVHNADSDMSKLSESLKLYNSWFAEATTSFKPKNIRKYYEHGIARILDPAGINVFFSGHNPLLKLGELGIGTNIDNRMFCGDNDMSPLYRNMGLYFDIGINNGVGIYGYSYEDSKISKNPRISRKDRTKFSGARYHGIARRAYLDSLEWDLARKLNYLSLRGKSVSYYYSIRNNKVVLKAA